MAIAVIILAAGQGTRMCSEKPKVLHKLAGKSLLSHVLLASLCNRNINTELCVIVHGHKGEHVRQSIEQELDYNNHINDHSDINLDCLKWVLQNEQLGTGHAVLTAIDNTNIHKELDKHSIDQLLVLYGDVPLIDVDDIEQLIATTGHNQLGILTLKSSNPHGLGRIIRDKANNNIIDIVEEKDADNKQKLITEVNTGIFLLPYPKVHNYLKNLKNNNTQNEYYLTDIIKKFVEDKVEINSVTVTEQFRYLGINNLHQLAQAERHYQLLTALKLLEQGVKIVDPSRIDIRGKLISRSDVTIDINCVFEGLVDIGKNCIIEPNCILKNVKLGDNTHVKANSIIEDAKINNNCIIGPFARIRPETVLDDNVSIGNFVEVKKSSISANSKINHLSYIGDCTMGRNVNIGAGTITCNYDGVNKHQTIIENNAFIGSNSALVAPVVIGENSTIGAGSTISKDAPNDKLTLARSQQKTIGSWQRAPHSSKASKSSNPLNSPKEKE